MRRVGTGRLSVTVAVVTLALGLAAPAAAEKPDESIQFVWISTPNAVDGACSYTASWTATGLIGKYTAELVVTAVDENENPIEEVSRQTWEILSTDTAETWDTTAEAVSHPQNEDFISFELSLDRGKGPKTVASHRLVSTPCP